MIYNISRNTTIAQHVTLADTFFSRMKGLLGRSHLPQGHALIITHCNSIHMLFMRFSIDVIFIDKNNKVVGLSANCTPFTFSPIFWKSSCAIELPTGTIHLSQTTLGDSLKVNS